ncbi:amidohydrolase [Ruegeria atlantica]|uniref:amidohydrolase n=1 Tax=Ruegeria atlantica TaxID=81569 RepID=UPI00147ED7B6|nr:amidohydrolase [Ruegeria atlantica]
MTRAFVLATTLLSPLAAGNAFSQPLVLTGADVYTVNENRDWAEAVGIDENGIIVAVGSEAEVIAAVGSDASIIDLEGRMVLPGFQDAHLHAIEAGVNAALCEFEPFDNLNGYRDSVLQCAENDSTGLWVRASGVNIPNLLDLHPNPVEFLDELLPDRPILILDDIGHGAWANSVALKAAGYDVSGDKANGNIILRNDQGTPNGVVLENAPHNLRTLAFLPTEDHLNFAYDSLLAAANDLNRNGITTVSDAGGYWPQGHHRVWDWAEEAGELTVRASNAFYVYPDRPLEEQLSELKGLFHNDPDRLVRFNQAKFYVDGILSQGTGALLEPYENDAGPELGYLYFPGEYLNEIAHEFSAAGFQLHFHVTGDNGARLALDAIAHANQDSGPHRLTHLYLVDPADYPRFAELNAIADFQIPPSALEDDYIDFIGEFIGDRTDRLLPAGDLLNAGATVTMSSDWDADELNPLIKISAVVSRETNGFPDVETAIEAMTINPAYLLQHDDKTGSIEVGKYADLVVISENILELPVSQIPSAEIEATLLQGEPVFDANGLFAE